VGHQPRRRLPRHPRGAVPDLTQAARGGIRRACVRARLQRLPVRGHPGPDPAHPRGRDRRAPYERVSPAAARIPGARLVTITSGGHLFLQQAHKVREASTAFIKEVVPSPPAT
jgi:hypothetical protein